MKSPDPERRSAEFRKNSRLEELLREVNGALAPVEERYLDDLADAAPEPRPVFVMGPHRSGSTLLLQVLAASGAFAYPTNFLSRFYGAPVFGARLQELLANPALDYRGELAELSAGAGFESQNGKTRGVLAPNEFWYFWRRFFPAGDPGAQTRAELEATADARGLRRELVALAAVLERPLALKAMILNQHVPWLAALFPRALFVRLRRDPVFNVQSGLEARLRQFGDPARWYSFRIREAGELEGLPPVESVAGQIHHIVRALDAGCAELTEAQRLTVEYEELCADPAAVLERLADALGLEGDARPVHRGPRSFEPQNTWRLERYTRDEVEAALARFAAGPEPAPAARPDDGDPPA